MKFGQRSRWVRDGILVLGMVLLTACGGAEPESALGIDLVPRSTPTSRFGPAEPTSTPPAPVSVELSDKFDAQGRLQEPLKIVSSDGLAILQIPAGATLCDDQGANLQGITLRPYYPHEAHLSEERLLYGLAYAFEPCDAHINPPATLTVRYDPPVLEPDKDENDPRLEFLGSGSDDWIALHGEIDLRAFGVSVLVEQLGVFMISLGIIFLPPMS